MALILDDIRIDGIDHEVRVSDHRGHIGAGWHRHLWQADAKNCISKECLDDFGNFGTRLDFVRDASEVLGIELNEIGGDADGTTGLLFS